MAPLVGRQIDKRRGNSQGLQPNWTSSAAGTMYDGQDPRFSSRLIDNHRWLPTGTGTFLGIFGSNPLIYAFLFF